MQLRLRWSAQRLNWVFPKDGSDGSSQGASKGKAHPTQTWLKSKFCTHNKRETAQNRFYFYLRLLRSRSSVSKSRRGCGVSLGPWDCSTEELEEMTVVWPDGWMVLNWNWGPIHRRRWGPVWVTISTWGKGTWAGINTQLQLCVMNGALSMLDSWNPAAVKWKGCSEPEGLEECLMRGNWGCLC